MTTFLMESPAARSAFVEHHLPERTGAFLDVGNLGDGGTYCNIIKKMVEERGGTYHGLDSNVNLTKEMGLSNQHLGDILEAPFDDGTFDVVYLGEIIEHTWDPRRMIRECRRILKDGGLLLIDTPNPYRLGMIMPYLLRSRDDMGDVPELTMQEALGEYQSMQEKGVVLLQPQHKIFFTPAMMRQLLITQGFSPVAWGCTAKGTLLKRIILRMFPQAGDHLCCAARKTSIKEAFTEQAS